MTFTRVLPKSVRWGQEDLASAGDTQRLLSCNSVSLIGSGAAGRDHAQDTHHLAAASLYTSSANGAVQWCDNKCAVAYSRRIRGYVDLHETASHRAQLEYVREHLWQSGTSFVLHGPSSKCSIDDHSSVTVIKARALQSLLSFAVCQGVYMLHSYAHLIS